jgi:ubiquinone/menaquinone biosynthesis C-methylase UbiE
VSQAWESMAAWYDEKQGDAGDLTHRALIDPALLRALGDVAGQRVLDFACGNGYIARRLAHLGAKVTGVDASAPIIDRARGREEREPLGITYHVADAADVAMLEAQTFDAAVCNMGLMDIEDAAGAIREVSRVLRPRGRFVASLSHPCFDVPEASAWVIERMDYTTTVWRKVRRYQEVFGGACPWKGPGVTWQTPAYHRPLSWYFRVLRSAGFVVTAFEEPEPTEEFMAGSPQGAWIAEVPLHCVIEAVLP